MRNSVTIGGVRNGIRNLHLQNANQKPILLTQLPLFIILFDIMYSVIIKDPLNKV
jgi:hypothetical protein